MSALKHIFIICMIAFAWQDSAHAQTLPEDTPVTLIADEIEFQREGQVLTAKSNVIIFYDGRQVKARKIIYYGDSERLEITGPITIINEDGTEIHAEYAELSSDLKSGLISGARLLMGEHLQIASAEGQYVNERYTTFYKTIASTCQVCPSQKHPLWQIRARRIIHDSVEKQLYFEDATFQILGQSVFALPRLRTPDPTVKRASGILVPEFSESDIYGYGFKLPYFFALDDYRDFTLTPFITSHGSVILETEYRQRFYRGGIDVKGAIALADSLSDKPGRGYINAMGVYQLDQGYLAHLRLEVTSDDAFMRQYEFSDRDRLTSELGISRFRKDKYLTANLVGFQTLRDDETNRTSPFVLPEVDYYKSWEEDSFGGTISLNANLDGLVRREGRNVAKSGVSLAWSKNWTGKSGLQINTLGRANLDFHLVDHDDNYSHKLLTRLTPQMGMEFRYPVSKANSKSTHVIEPIVQFVWTGSDNTIVPNEDSTQLEFEESNLFVLNHFPGNDRYETGLRANIGVSYTRYNENGWNYSFGVGQIIRAKNNTQFSEGSGLRGRSSDFVGSFAVEFPPHVSMINRVLFDDDLDFSKAEGLLSLNYEKFNLTAGYVYLEPDTTAGAIDVRSEASLDFAYRITDNWEFSGNWRRNLADGNTVETGAKLKYGNECIKVQFSASRDYTYSIDVPKSTSYGLSINLAGFGGGANSGSPAHRCAKLR